MMAAVALTLIMHSAVDGTTVAEGLPAQLRRIAVRNSGGYERYLFDAYHLLRIRIERSSPLSVSDSLLKNGWVLLDRSDPLSHSHFPGYGERDSAKTYRIFGGDPVCTQEGVTASLVATDLDYDGTSGGERSDPDHLCLAIVFRFVGPSVSKKVDGVFAKDP